LFVFALVRKPIPDPGFGQKKIGASRVALNPTPQAKDGRPQGAPPACRVGSPELCKDAVEGCYMARPARQKREDAQVSSGKRDPLIPNGDFVVEQVDQKRSASIEASTPCRIEASQLGYAHARRQIPLAEGTSEVVSIQIQNGDAVCSSIAAADHDDVRVGVGALCLTQLVEVELRLIDENNVEWTIGFRRRPDQAALRFESRSDQAHEFEFARYDEYARPTTPPNARSHDSSAALARCASPSKCGMAARSSVFLRAPSHASVQINRSGRKPSAHAGSP
jgi:hypothetical protein